MTTNVINLPQSSPSGGHMLASGSIAHIEKKGGGGHDGGMESRIAHLEADMAEVKVTLGRVEAAMHEMLSLAQKIDVRLTRLEDRSQKQSEDIAEIKGRISSLPSADAFGELKGRLANVPNWWQMFIFIFAAVGGAASLHKIIP